ncbi:MAG: HAD family hydrolase [Lachnospiraceae bacterium]|nr:HAD family hydrolase [Lachnospiraceae bacterium]
MYHTILFDLDGTLTDPGPGITNSVSYALQKFGIRVTDRTRLYKFIGPPLNESFQEFLGFSVEESQRAVAYYREYYGEQGIYENQLYDGVEPLLEDLQAKGRKIVLATSKPEKFAVKILEHFHITNYFDFVAGSNMDGSRSKKAEVLTHALKHLEITDKSSVVMVGDREHDIFGAEQVGIDSIGVLYGYGSKEELRDAGATYIVNVPEEISDIIYR